MIYHSNPVSTDPTDATRHRAMWSAALLAVLHDYHRAYHRRPEPQRVLDEMRLYLDSRDGRTVQACAGVDVSYRRAVELVTLPRAEFRRRMTRVGVEGGE